MPNATDGIFTQYRSEILQLHERGTPAGDIFDILLAKHPELRGRTKKGAVRTIKRNLGKLGEVKDFAIREQRTTQGSNFHALKTELGLHENEYNLPEPLDDEIKVHQLPVACNKIHLLSDIHIPFHSIAALTVTLKYGKDRGANTIYINGDGIDFYGISRFEKEKRLRSLKNEIDQFREFVEIIDRIYPNAIKYYKMGNHCARWDSYIRQNAKEFEDIDDFAFSNVMRLNQFGWHIIGDRDFAKAGKLHILHGHEMMQAVSPVNPARGVYLKAMQSCIVGHHHRTSEHSGKNIGGDFITCWSTGCLSQLRPKYNPLSSYNHGFAFIETERDGDFIVENKRIDNGKIY